MTTRVLAVCVMVVALGAGRASAQETVGDVVGFLVTNQAVQTGDFERDRAAAEAARQTITRALLLNLTSVPLASSSSGFLYRLNPQLGTVERVTQSFGAFFVERALTPGRGRVSFGVSASTSAFDRLGDLHLRDGSLLTVANRFRDEPTPFDTESLTLRVRSRTMTLVGSVGVTDRLEIGGALPLVELSVEGQRINVYRGEQTLQASGEGTASGIGDAAIRAKYTLASTPNAAFAAAAEIRLPTGDAENLIGAGETAYRFFGIGSFETGRLTLLGNGGFVFGGISKELNIAGAASVAVQPRFTLSGEILVRRVNELGDIRLVSEPHPTIAGVDTMRLATVDTGTLITRLVAGAKWNASRGLVLGGHVLFPLAYRGLTAPFTPTVTVEYSF